MAKDKKKKDMYILYIHIHNAFNSFVKCYKNLLFWILLTYPQDNKKMQSYVILKQKLINLIKDFHIDKIALIPIKEIEAILQDMKETGFNLANTQYYFQMLEEAYNNYIY